MNPFFSIIIPLYNKEDYILQTLESVINQTFTDFEVLIINDGSTDRSSAIAERINDPRIHILHQKNQGVSVARNTGIAASNGEYIALLDADDLWLPNHLESLHRLIHKFPEAGLYCSRYAIKYSEEYIRQIILSQPVIEEQTIIENYFSGSLIDPIAWISASAFRENDFLEIGKFDPKLRTAEDVDIFVRFALNYTIAFNNKTTMTYVKNTTSDSLSKVEYNDERSYFLKKYTNTEAKNYPLKIYLDQIRVAVAIRSKMIGQKTISKKLVSDISINDLNKKQKILLKLPPFMIRFLLKTHHFLIRNKIYIKPLR